MSLRVHHFFNNTRGLNLNTDLGDVDESSAEEIINLHTSGNGAWSSRNIGYTYITPSALNSGATITGMCQYSDTNAVEHTVVSAGNKAYDLTLGNGNSIEIASGWDDTATVNFLTFQNLLISCNGKQAPQKWSGSGSFTNLLGWPPTIAGITVGNPSFGTVFANRVILSGDSQNPSLIYISALESAENYTPTSGSTSAGAIQVAPGDGDQITGLKTLYLPLENEEVLIIFKQRSIYLLSGKDSSTFALQKVSSNIGAVSHNSIILLGNDLLFLSLQGISSLSTTTLHGNLSDGSTSQSIQTMIKNLNPYALKKSFALHLAYRQEIWWFVAEGSSSENQVVLVYQYATNNAKGIWSKRTGFSATCGLVLNNTIYTANSVGHIARQLKGNSYNGAAITWKYSTPFYSLGNANLRKRIRSIELFLTQLANTNFTLKACWNNIRNENQKQSRSIQVTLDTQSTLYGTALYGSNNYDTAGICRKKVMIDGSGQRMQLTFTGTQTLNPVEIQGWSITSIDGGLQ